MESYNRTLLDMFSTSIKTHSIVLVAKKTKKDAQHTSVLFTGTVKQPTVSSKLLSRFLPNLYISALHTHYFTYQN